MTSRFDRKASPPSRRAFLKNAGGIAIAASGIGALGYSTYGLNPVRQKIEKILTFPKYFQDSGPTLPKLSIVHGSKTDAMVRGAVEQLGGMSQFVNKGEKVIIKPNVGWDRQPEQAANTGPEVVSAVIHYSLQL